MSVEISLILSKLEGVGVLWIITFYTYNVCVCCATRVS